MKSETITIPIKGVYFDQIKSGKKTEEYRLATPFWKKRLEGRNYKTIVLTKGYPKRTDTERRLSIKWNGCELKTIQHPHFGPDPVEVYAIDVTALSQPNKKEQNR